MAVLSIRAEAAKIGFLPRSFPLQPLGTFKGYVLLRKGRFVWAVAPIFLPRMLDVVFAVDKRPLSRIWPDLSPSGWSRLKAAVAIISAAIAKGELSEMDLPDITNQFPWWTGWPPIDQLSVAECLGNEADYE